MTLYDQTKTTDLRFFSVIDRNAFEMTAKN